jgi:hypothetical protein
MAKKVNNLPKNENKIGFWFGNMYRIILSALRGDMLSFGETT